MDLPTNESSNSPIPEQDPRVLQFVELYTQHCSQIQYYLMALVPSSHDAIDVMQETSLVLWQKFETFEPGTNFMAWACKIARFQALKHFQRSKASGSVFESSVLEKLAVDAQEAAPRQNPSLASLDFCISKLTEIDQVLIRRRYQPDGSVKQIAKDVGRTANSVSKSLGRIRRSLLQCMHQQLAKL